MHRPRPRQKASVGPARETGCLAARPARPQAPLLGRIPGMRSAGRSTSGDCAAYRQRRVCSPRGARLLRRGQEINANAPQMRAEHLRVTVRVSSLSSHVDVLVQVSPAPAVSHDWVCVGEVSSSFRISM